MATKADQIRQLAKSGLTVSEIATRVGVRYQHVYNTLSEAERQLGRARKSVRATNQAKPELPLSHLLDRGFKAVSYWVQTNTNGIGMAGPVPKGVGVYAFAVHGIVQYVGVATMGLAKRLYFYAKPGATQRTSLRINAIIGEITSRQKTVEIAVAMPEDLSWNGLPVHGAAGLELGLIKAFALPWNMRSSG